jgi:hypothetical protein
VAYTYNGKSNHHKADEWMPPWIDSFVEHDKTRPTRPAAKETFVSFSHPMDMNESSDRLEYLQCIVPVVRVQYSTVLGHLEYSVLYSAVRTVPSSVLSYLMAV